MNKDNTFVICIEFEQERATTEKMVDKLIWHGYGTADKYGELAGYKF